MPSDKQQGARSPGPLSGIRVLDLSRVMAGPWAGQIFADLGADVIKVERPGVGDDTRAWGPPFLKARDGSETGESGYYLSCNRGKKSVTVSLDTTEGQQIVRRLAAQSDVVLENFKVGTLAKFNLAYDDLRRTNPRLIYCSITGFGQTGPRKDQVAYDFLIQAMGGLMSITGEQDGKPGGGPMKVGVPIVDLVTGHYAVIAVLAALARRGKTDEGDYIDLAMLDVQATMLANQAMNFLLTGNTPGRHGNGHPNIMPQQTFHCRDGAIVLAIGNDGQYRRLCQALDRADLGSDPRYASNAGRVKHRDALLGTLAGIFATYERATLLDALNRLDVPSGPINTVPEVFSEAQIIDRGIVRQVDHPTAGTVPQLNGPIRYRNAGSGSERAPPLLGEHTAEILAGVGYGTPEIDAFAARGII